MFLRRLLRTLCGLSWLHRLPMGQFVVVLIGPLLPLALILLPSIFLHLLYILMSRLYHLMQRETQKVLRFTPKQAAGSSRNCPLLRFALYFPGGLERLRGSVWGLDFLPPLHIILFTSLQTSSPPNPQSSVCTSRPHGNWSPAEKHNNEGLTGSDSGKADAVRGLGRWYYEQAILCL